MKSIPIERETFKISILPKNLRLSAIEQIQKAQQITKQLNDKLAKKEGFLV